MTMRDREKCGKYKFLVAFAVLKVPLCMSSSTTEIPASQKCSEPRGGWQRKQEKTSWKWDTKEQKEPRQLQREVSALTG